MEHRSLGFRYERVRDMYLRGKAPRAKPKPEAHVTDVLAA